MFDKGRHERAKIGFVLLATEQTIEADMFRLCPPGVGMHFARAYIDDCISVDSLSRHREDLSRAAASLLPDGSIDLICYACTSGSLVIGETAVFNELRKGAPQAQLTSLITSVIRALQAVSAERIAIATPYLDEINTMEQEYLQQAGFQVTAIRGLNLVKDSDMVRVTPEYLAEFAASVDTPDSDALFISCGALRSLEIVDALEQRLGKPVICSNQAMFWDVLRSTGINDRISGYGQLLSQH